jgi:hypothetical protein
MDVVDRGGKGEVEGGGRRVVQLSSFISSIVA